MDFTETQSEKCFYKNFYRFFFYSFYLISQLFFVRKRNIFSIWLSVTCSFKAEFRTLENLLICFLSES